jgi:pimeloyl-ACP methyl ester carboxylesterase
VPTVDANGIEIHVERVGAGPRLLFLGGSGQTVEESRPLLELLASRFDVITFDPRGLGRTTIPPGPYRLRDYGADAAAVAGAAGWRSCRVFGVSFGGMVAQELAVTWPERIERLVLACTSPGGAFSSYPLDELASMDEARRAAVGRTLLDTRFTDEWLDAHPSDRALADALASRAAPAGDPEVERGRREQLLARRTHDVCDRLGRVTCPTLVAAGRYDGIAPPENAHAIAGRIPGATLRFYEGGHAFFAQDPAALPEILDFLEGVPPEEDPV